MDTDVGGVLRIAARFIEQSGRARRRGRAPAAVRAPCSASTYFCGFRKEQVFFQAVQTLPWLFPGLVLCCSQFTLFFSNFPRPVPIPLSGAPAWLLLRMPLVPRAWASPAHALSEACPPRSLLSLPPPLRRLFLSIRLNDASYSAGRLKGCFLPP